MVCKTEFWESRSTASGDPNGPTEVILPIISMQKNNSGVDHV